MPEKTNSVFISVGSNIRKEFYIHAAITELKRLFKKIKISPVFETPFDGKGVQGNYYNFCAKIRTGRGILELKRLFRKLERKFGRARGKKKDAPRTLDIDILLFNGLIDTKLNLPYRDFGKKAYVLRPLKELAPKFLVARAGKTVEKLFSALPKKAKRGIKEVLLGSKNKNNSAMPKPHYYAVAATTIDGYIARSRHHRSFGWTSREDKAHLHRMIGRADAVILTRSGYASAKRARKKHCIVITRSVKSVERKSPLLTFINVKNAGIDEYVRSAGFREVCILGGTFVYSCMLSKGLIDDVYLTIEPTAFGRGLGVFGQKVPARHFRLAEIKKLNKKGSLLLHYKYISDGVKHRK